MKKNMRLERAKKEHPVDEEVTVWEKDGYSVARLRRPTSRSYQTWYRSFGPKGGELGNYDTKREAIAETSRVIKERKAITKFKKTMRKR